MTEHARAFPKPEGIYSPTQWRQFYFYGISDKKPSEIQLDSGMIQSLLSAVGVSGAIATPTAFDPKLIINPKGTTVWMELFVFALVKDSDGLQAVANGSGRLMAPAGHGRETFSGNVNWPDWILRSNPVDLKQGWLFIIPLLIHKSASQPTQLGTSLKSPNETLEVLGLAEFHDDAPESFLAYLAAVAKNVNKTKGTDSR